MMKVTVLPYGMYGENTYVLRNEGQVLIIDPGCRSELVISTIEKSEHVEGIVLTHGHEDHVQGVDAIVDKYHCPVWLSEEDMPLVNPKTCMEHHFASPVYSDMTVLPSVLDVPGFHIDVLTTPGHTHGSVCLLIEECMFSGDTLFAGSIGRTDLVDSDSSEMRASLLKLKSITENYHVLSGHGPATTLKKEQEDNPFFAYL